MELLFAAKLFGRSVKAACDITHLCGVAVSASILVADYLVLACVR